MTKVYVVLVEDLIEHKGKVSQEGYKTLREAQAFIRSRGGYMQRLDNWTYLQNYNCLYIITEVEVKGL